MMRISPTQLARQLVNTLEQVGEVNHSQVLEVFAEMLVEHRLRHQLPRIMAALEAELNQRAGVVKARFTSATEVSAAQIKDIAEQLSKSVGKQVEMESHRDHHLIGGAIIQVGDVVYDGSVRTQLARLRQSVEIYG